jgi:hypothetical protein
VSVRPAVLAIAIVFASCLASCGGSDDDGDQVSLPSGHADVAVIEGWIDTLSDGDVSGAADYFAVPSVAENGAGDPWVAGRRPCLQPLAALRREAGPSSAARPLHRCHLQAHGASRRSL